MIKTINNIINYVYRTLIKNQEKAFCNIAEGTHSGFITLIADSDISKSNLILTMDSLSKVSVAMDDDKPLGVSCDCADAGENIAVALGGCVSQTILCIASTAITAGTYVYLADYGKITATKTSTSYLIGLALNSSSIDGIVEVDPQGFGQIA